MTMQVNSLSPSHSALSALSLVRRSGIAPGSLVLGVLFFFTGADSRGQETPASAKPKITWKKIVIDTTFRSEGVAVADFNKDGKKDIFVGDVWYEAPDWKMHEVRPHKKWDGDTVYSDSFACFTGDFNGDGYP